MNRKVYTLAELRKIQRPELAGIAEEVGVPYQMRREPAEPLRLLIFEYQSKLEGERDERTALRAGTRPALMKLAEKESGISFSGSVASKDNIIDAIIFERRKSKEGPLSLSELVCLDMNKLRDVFQHRHGFKLTKETRADLLKEFLDEQSTILGEDDDEDELGPSLPIGTLDTIAPLRRRFAR